MRFCAESSGVKRMKRGIKNGQEMPPQQNLVNELAEDKILTSGRVSNFTRVSTQTLWQLSRHHSAGVRIM